MITTDGMKGYAALCVLLVCFGGAVTSAFAYSCEAEFAKADVVIKEAEGAMRSDTDARIKGLLAEAQGLLEAAKIGHRQASERHTGDKGKYMHGDAVRKARWAYSLASEVTFLATGTPR